MELYCYCAENISDTSLKDYLPAFAVIVVGVLGLVKIKLDANTKSHLEWIKEFRDATSKYITESDNSIILFHKYLSERIRLNYDYGSEQDILNWEKGTDSTSRADILSTTIRLLLNPKKSLHSKVERLLIEREKSIKEIFTTYNKTKDSGKLKEISDKNAEIRGKLPALINSIQEVIVDETENSKKIFS